MGSNPTPRASNVGSIKEINKDFSEVIPEEIFYKKEEMTLQNLQKIQQEKGIGKSIDLEQKIDSITRSLSKPYFNTSLKELSKSNIENANTICNYILAEQTEI
ncbi:MAG: hypothetical protein R3321_09495, partial [Nitrososphaeraceae archaeon]|nr:hypothetical protein [Nitrososphaeraceae archaeon]